MEELRFRAEPFIHDLTWLETLLFDYSATKSDYYLYCHNILFLFTDFIAVFVRILIIMGIERVRGMINSVMEKRIDLLESYCVKFCFAVPDGFVLPKSEEGLREAQKKIRLVQMPSLIEYFGYCLCCGSHFAGPVYEMKDYLQWTEGKGIWDTSEKRKQPSPFSM